MSDAASRTVHYMSDNGKSLAYYIRPDGSLAKVLHSLDGQTFYELVIENAEHFGVPGRFIVVSDTRRDLHQRVIDHGFNATEIYENELYRFYANQFDTEGVAIMPLYGELEWQILFVGDIEVDPGRYTKYTMSMQNGTREGTFEDAFEWTAEELCFWDGDRYTTGESLTVNWGYWLQVHNGSTWVEIKLLEPAPRPVELVNQTAEPSDDLFHEVCPGVCGQLADNCTCDNPKTWKAHTANRSNVGR